jgi:hypothetical protein
MRRAIVEFVTKISQLRTQLIPIRCGKISPHMGIDIIFYYSLTEGVFRTQISLGRGILLFG